MCLISQGQRVQVLPSGMKTRVKEIATADGKPEEPFDIDNIDGFIRGELIDSGRYEEPKGRGEVFRLA